jgi:RNA polymerase subunit RPABC4/transcription elongation factor Spt4
MPCITFQTSDAPRTAFIWGGKKVRLCPFCHNEYAARLCDFRKPTGSVCNNAMCEKCATRVGPDQDYCPTHKDGPPPAQREMFGDAQ